MEIDPKIPPEKRHRFKALNHHSSAAKTQYLHFSTRVNDYHKIVALRRNQAMLEKARELGEARHYASSYVIRLEITWDIASPGRSARMCPTCGARCLDDQSWAPPDGCGPLRSAKTVELKKPTERGCFPYFWYHTYLVRQALNSLPAAKLEHIDIQTHTTSLLFIAMHCCTGYCNQYFNIYVVPDPRCNILHSTPVNPPGVCFEQVDPKKRFIAYAARVLQKQKLLQAASVKRLEAHEALPVAL